MQIIDAVLRLKDQFTPTITNATRHLSEHRSQQMRVANSIKTTGKSISELGNKFALLSAPILAAATAGAKLNSELTTALAKVSTLVDTNIVDMQKMRSELIALSNETGVSVVELTEGTYQAISASVDASKAIDFMRVSALGAKAGFTDMTTATDALTSIINAYGMEVERASNMMDLLITTQNLGKTTVDQVGKSLGQVIPTAAAAGMTVEELMASVAALTAVGMQTPDSMTAIKAALSNIIKPSSEAAELAAELGLNFNQAHLQAVGWAKFLEEVKTATGGNVEMLGKLFGSTKALNAILSLTGNGAEKFAKSLDGMANSAGATDKAVSKINATPAQQLAKATNELKNAGMELAQGLSPLISRTATLTKSFAKWLNSLSPLQRELLFGLAQFIVIGGVVLKVVGSAVTMFGSWYGSIIKASSAIRSAGSVTGALATKFPFLQTAVSGIVNGFRSFVGLLGTMGRSFLSAFTTMGRAILTLRNPFMAIRLLFATNPIGLALLALTIIIPIVISHFNDFKQVFIVVFNHIKETAAPILENLKSKFMTVFEKLQKTGEKFSAAYDKIMAAFSGSTAENGSVVSVILNNLGAAFEVTFDLIAIYLNGFFSVMAVVIGSVIDIAGELISFIANVFTGNWEGAWENIKNIFMIYIDAIKGVFSGMIDTISSGLDYILGRASEAKTVSSEAESANIEGHWTGSSWFSGGKTWVHEKGAELINLPAGSQIVPHAESLKQQYQKGYAKGRAQQSQATSINVAKLADSIVVREEADIDKFANMLVFKLQQHSMNNMVGAV